MGNFLKDCRDRGEGEELELEEEQLEEEQLSFVFPGPRGLLLLRDSSSVGGRAWLGCKLIST